MWLKKKTTENYLDVFITSRRSKNIMVAEEIKTNSKAVILIYYFHRVSLSYGLLWSYIGRSD